MNHCRYNVPVYLNYPMSTKLIKSDLRWLLMGTWILCACNVFADNTKPEQRNARNASKETLESPAPTKSETNKPARSVTLARNTSVKAKSGAVVTTARPKTDAEKKTIARCWKRLMNMAREIRHAQNKKWIDIFKQKPEGLFKPSGFCLKNDSRVTARKKL